MGHCLCSQDAKSLFTYQTNLPHVYYITFMSNPLYFEYYNMSMTLGVIQTST